MLPSDLRHRRGPRPDDHDFPEPISNRVCAEFTASFRQAHIRARERLRNPFRRPQARIFPLTFNKSEAFSAALTKFATGAKVQPAKEHTMPAIDPDELPKKKIVHEMGQDLSLLSVGELTERIMLLREEIARLEGEKARKSASKSAADSFFKK